ncbi:MAG: hypothetical protein IKR70_08415 [Lachnospiraceae bacterium]|nr:hypothetical protein [Lachnospiraceae bacterium]
MHYLSHIKVKTVIVLIIALFLPGNSIMLYADEALYETNHEIELKAFQKNEEFLDKDDENKEDSITFSKDYYSSVLCTADVDSGEGWFVSKDGRVFKWGG